jgi:hypothetical protein
MTQQTKILKCTAARFSSVYSRLNFIILAFVFHGAGEANQFSASQEIPHILWNLKVHYHIYKCLPLYLSQINPAHNPQPTS